MSELLDLSPPRTPVDPSQIQQNILEEQVELWWFRNPKQSTLCYCVAVVLILVCGVGGIVLLSTTTSRSSEWRLGVGTALCLLALLILLKQLLSSAVQDMNCLRSRNEIDALRSGGSADYFILLATGLLVLACGIILLVLSNPRTINVPGKSMTDMFIAGVALIPAGFLILVGLAIYLLVTWCYRPSLRQAFRTRNLNFFSISGGMMTSQRETTSSTSNLI
ncbi:transmembrane protein 125 [Latimeria chalumnae]|uniref:Transmembrane protein 125 n=1 Tax=Latimeria chalumnae TaxID=7897 RepID=H2ZZ40_LATCH|nr:PREDICTED: transmembrane protein 125 [Latimeria chalumnae]|eukprot:XP_006009040.1 PREDICTED: transmembrane protein 125 [Latimeria chalumnae]